MASARRGFHPVALVTDYFYSALGKFYLAMREKRLIISLEQLPELSELSAWPAALSAKRSSQ
jgi:hypothetical protein